MRPSSARRPVLAVVPALAALLVAGCASDEQAAPEPSPTPIADLNTAAMQVPRIEFCPAVPSAAVTEAIGGKAESEAAYGNGDEVTLPRVGRDVVHELGCSWARTTGRTARAWVFARPVDVALARTVVTAAGATPGCRSVPGPEFGEPSSTQVCRTSDGAARVRHAGLFGQTWLTCELSAPAGAGTDDDAALRARTDRWCVEVLGALNAAR